MTNPLQYSCLEKSMDRGYGRATVHGVARVKHDLVTKSPPPGYSEIVGMGALSNRVWEESLMKSVNRYSRQA